MKKILFTVSLLTVILASDLYADGTQHPTSQELIRLVLEQARVKHCKYWIVDSRTSIDVYLGSAYKGKARSMLIQSFSRSLDMDATSLVSKLFQVNKQSTSIPQPVHGNETYKVDLNNMTAKYWKKNGGWWPKFYADNPGACGMLSISIPAFDANTGIFLIYIGTQCQGLAGAGYVKAFYYSNGSIVELNKHRVWIS